MMPYRYRLLLTSFTISMYLCMLSAQLRDTESITGSAHTATESLEIVLADLPEASTRVYQDVEPKAVPFMPIPLYDKYTQDLPKAALESVPERAKAVLASPAPTLSFKALDDSLTRIPPDAHGAIGVHHVMTTLNDRIRVQYKNGAILNTVNIDTFFQVPAGAAFDPKVIYDPYAQRWIATCCAYPRTNNSQIILAVSASDNATGAWKIYKVKADAANIAWADYPSIGFNKKWIAVQVNMFNISNNAYNKSHIYLFNKANVYAFGTGALTLITDTTGATQAPALTYDPHLEPLYLISNIGSQWIRLYAVTGAVGSESLSTIAYPSAPTPWASFVSPINGGFAPQAGTTRRIDNGDSRIMNVVYRNNSLWTAHTVFLPAPNPTRSAIQWWELSSTGAVKQRGLIQDPTATATNGGSFFAYPSIAVNNKNDVLIGYSRFASTLYASAAYSFRAGTDPLNTLRGSMFLQMGLAPYIKDFGTGRVRWGDYSATVTDPTNDTSLWTIQTYADIPALNGMTRWATWWGRIDA